MSEPVKEFHITWIDVRMAQALINGGEAGFYACHAQAPISHPEMMCVFAAGDWWLISNGEFQVRDHGIAIVPGLDGGWTRAHKIEVDSEHPIARLLLQDAEANRGPDLPVPLSLILENIWDVRKMP